MLAALLAGMFSASRVRCLCLRVLRERAEVDDLKAACIELISTQLG